MTRCTSFEQSTMIELVDVIEKYHRVKENGYDPDCRICQIVKRARSVLDVYAIYGKTACGELGEEKTL